MAEIDSQLFPRFSAKRVATALTDTPVVMLIGPRQCGKTTLLRQFGNGEREYVTLDHTRCSNPLATIRLALCVD
ncbi:AAA family ATPase [Edaphobacter sp. HDX4]|uniref:AAA family ATPase n=1 Tax=Edaphobacter sp. HDX4 TaxID=2794064 RepID=UPI003ACAA737